MYSISIIVVFASLIMSIIWLYITRDLAGCATFYSPPVFLFFALICSFTSMTPFSISNSEFHFIFILLVIRYQDYLSFPIHLSTKFRITFFYNSAKYFNSLPVKISIKISLSLSYFCSASSCFIASLTVFKQDWYT